MKKLLIFFIFISSVSFAQLPNYITPEEQGIMNSYLISARSYTSPAAMMNSPASPVRASAEWEEIDGLMVAWAGYTNILSEIVSAARLETQVYIICGSSCNRTDSTST